MAATQAVPLNGAASGGAGFAANPAPAMHGGQAPATGANAASRVTTTAMVPVEDAREERPTQLIDEGRHAFSPIVARLPVELDVMVPVRDFRVHNLLALEPGQIVESQWGHGDDVPIAAGEVTLAWSEFEVMDTELAVRITRLV